MKVFIPFIFSIHYICLLRNYLINYGKFIIYHLFWINLYYESLLLKLKQLKHFSPRLAPQYPSGGPTCQDKGLMKESVDLGVFTLLPILPLPLPHLHTRRAAASLSTQGRAEVASVTSQKSTETNNSPKIVFKIFFRPSS